jgi:hypothetical protein
VFPLFTYKPDILRAIDPDSSFARYTKNSGIDSELAEA